MVHAIHRPAGVARAIISLLPLFGTLTPAFGQAQVDAEAAETRSSAAMRVADEFHRSFQSMVWAGMVERLHPEALAYLRLAVVITVDADTTGWALERLLDGVPDRAAFDRLSDAEVVVRVMRGVETEVPGLFSSLVGRRSEVLGAVAEGPDTAHVVYRIVTLADGAVPSVEALTLVRHEGRWLVRSAEEIDVLHTALRRVPIPRPSPGGWAPPPPVSPAVPRPGG